MFEIWYFLMKKKTLTYFLNANNLKFFNCHHTEHTTSTINYYVDKLFIIKIGFLYGSTAKKIY
jgi:hypothetical protein